MKINNIFKKSLFFLFLFFLKYLFYRFGKKTDKVFTGVIGEKYVSSLLKRLNPNEYKILNDKTLYFNKEKAQIDHLIISNFGIFVIETKNFNGTIFGQEDSNYWTQVLSYSNKENFINPIRQNNWHIHVLKSILTQYPQVTYYPIVVFTNNSDLRVKTVTDVVKTDDLIKTIRRHQIRVISDYDRDKIFNYFN